MAAPDAGSLRGVSVLVTRPAHQAEALVRLVEQAGGEAVCFPVLEILEPSDHTALLAQIDRLEEFDLAIFISANAVQQAMNAIAARRVWPEGLRVAAVGRASAKALTQFGHHEVIAPTGRFDSEALLALPPLQEVNGRRILILRGDGGRELLGETLLARGAYVEYAECYRRVKPQVNPAPLLRRWARGGIDIVTVSSGQGLRNLYDLLGKLGQQWLVQTPIVVPSARSAAICQELGFKIAPIVASDASDTAMMAAIRAWRAPGNSL